MSGVITDEVRRLGALERYDILDSPREEVFDRVTRLVRRFFDVPMSTITFIDGHRQWFKSRDGIATPETSKGPALCNVVVQEARPLIVNDTLEDERFKANPFVIGEPEIRFYAGVPLLTPDRQSIGTLCAMDTVPRDFGPDHLATLRDLASIVVDELHLRMLVSTDDLTGALSRGAFREAGDRTLALAVRHRHDLSCISVDLDHFKRVNDVHGHGAGDVVLATSIATLRANLRKSDPIGRMGGEEFAILLPMTGRAAALQVADKLRSALAAQIVDLPSGPLSITGSFGVTILDRSVSDLDSLLEHADKALYAAKEGGRNRCVEWRPDETISPGIRRRVLKAGKLSFNGGHSSIDCTVRSLSDTSAGVDVISSAGVPELFKLAIEADGFSRLCRIATKRDRHIEVEFA